MSKFRHRFEPGRGVVDGEAQFVLNSFSFAFGVSLSTWKVIDWTIGARISPDVEATGQDVAELMRNRKQAKQAK